MKDITGNTYPVKEQLKAIGATWNKFRKVWTISDEKFEDAQEIVKNQRPTTRINYTRFSSGAVHYQNSRGRCEDAPCCGCCN